MKYKAIQKSIFLATIIIFGNFLFAAAENRAEIQVRHTNDDQIIIDLAIDSLVVNEISRDNRLYSQLLFNNLDQASRPGFPNLPLLTKQFNVTAGNLQASFNILEEKIINLDYPVELFSDDAKGAAFNTDVTEATWQTYPDKLLNVNFDGFYRNMPISTINFYPVQIISENKIRLIKKAALTIQLNQSNLDLAAAGKPETLMFENSKVGSVRKPAQKASQANPLFGKPFIRLEVSKDGIYRLDYQTLNNLEIDLENIDPQTFALYNHGKQVPIYIYGEKDRGFHKQDYIEFIGKRNPNSSGNTSMFDPFTDVNIYQLYWNIEQGLRFSEESASPTYKGQDLIKPVEYDYLFRFEKNEKFQRLGYVYTDVLSTDNDQYFFSKQILSGTSQVFEFFLPSPNRNTTKNIQVKAKLQSLAQDIYSTARILINGQNIGKNTWYWRNEGYVEQNPEFYIPNNFLKEGINTLTVNLEHNPNDQTSSIVLDWLEIQYYRSFIAHENYIEFNKPNDQINGLYQFEVENFSDLEISVYKNEQTKITDFQKSFSEASQSYSIRLQDEINGPTDYLAASGAKLALPDTTFLDTVHNILDINGCDHLCIVADQFYNATRELVDFYADQGIVCHRVKVSDIYNQFNNGIKSPYAIRTFLKSAYESWQNFPKWALLIGDANLNNRAEDLLPTVMYQTYKWGGSASDYWYALLSGDDNIPDIHIGRWAAGSQPEIETLIRKRTNYTNEQTAGPWRNKHLFIAGKENDFKIQTDFITEHLLQTPVTTSRILINPSNVNSRFYGGTDTLVNRINRGLRVINFMGHGGGAVWADRSLFRLEDLYKLRNGNKLPFISSLTCFTSDFAASQSLGESITERFNSGAIGLFGASGVGWMINDFLLGKELFLYIQEEDLSVGEIINLAKIRYFTGGNQFNYLKNSMIYQYNLLGDPGVMIAHTDEESHYLELENTTIKPNDEIKISGQLPYENGKLELQIYDSKKYPISPVIPYSFTTRDFSTSIFLPDSVINTGYVSVYGTSSAEDHDFANALYFASQRTAYKNFTLSPASIKYGDSVHIAVDFITIVDSVKWEIDTTGVAKSIDSYGREVIYAFSQSDSTILQIDCPQTQQLKYTSNSPFVPTKPGKYYAHRITWYVDDKKFQGPAMIFDINPPYDIEILSYKQGGLDFPALELDVVLHGDDTISTAITVYKYPYYTRNEFNQYILNDSSIIYEGTQELLPETRETIYLPVITGIDTAVGLVNITGPDAELRTSNNRVAYNFPVTNRLVSADLGTTYDGETNDTLWYNDEFFIYIPPNTVPESCVLSCRRTMLDNLSQPDFIPVFPNDTIAVQYKLALSKNLIFNKEGSVGFKFSSNRDNINLVRYKPILNLWQEQYTTTAKGLFIANFLNPGDFSLAQIKDIQVPGIEVNFDGKRIDEQSYVDSYPTISFIFNDDNGINLTEEGLKIWIDDNPVAFNELIKPDTVQNFTNVNCSYRSNLETGRHIIKVSIEDAAKNINEEEFEFNIFKNLKILDYGNYPNPFQTRTWFVFETTKNVEEFKINIYSVSGRKIRTIDDTNIYEDKSLVESGYHEVSWDGKDDNGDDIANGVYYYKMIAKTNDRTVSTKGVIAKAK